MAKDQAEHIIVGRIDAPYGVKGWVKIFSFTDPIERILEYSPWQVSRRGKVEKIVVAEGMKQGRRLVALPEGYEDRSQAELLNGADIWIEKGQLPELEQGEHYWHELEGLNVVNLQGDDLGIVDHLVETGSNDVMVVRATGSSIDDRERLIPWVEDQVVKSVDKVEKRILVDWQADY